MLQAIVPAWRRFQLERAARDGNSYNILRDISSTIPLQVLCRIVASVGSIYAMRCLQPAELGRASFAASVAAQVAIWGDFGLGITGVRSIAGAGETAGRTISLVLGIRVCAGILLSAVFLVLSNRLAGAHLVNLTAFVILSVFLTQLSLQWIFQGLQRVPLYNVITVGQTLLSAALFVVALRPGSKAEAYLAISLGCACATLAVQLWLIRHDLRPLGLPTFIREGRQLIRHSAAAFGMIAAIYVYTGMDGLVVGLLRDVTEVGLYRSAQGIQGMLAPILGIVPTIVYPGLVRANRRGPEHLRALIRFVTFSSMAAAFALLFASVAILPWFFATFLGARYVAATNMCLVLIAAKCIVLVGSGPSWALCAVSREGTMFQLALVAAGVWLFVAFFAGQRAGGTGIACASLLAELVITVGSGYTVFKSLAKTV